MKNSESPDKEKFTGDKKGILFYIDCPCNCGRAIRMVLPSAKPVEDFNIPKIGNKFWQRLVNEKGLEEAIEFLHENA